MNYDEVLHPVQPLACTINGLHASLAVQVGTPTHREDGDGCVRLWRPSTGPNFDVTIPLSALRRLVAEAEHSDETTARP